jgi:hypothetical protein
MSITVYGQLTTGTPAGPYYSGGDITAIASGINSAYLVGFITGAGVSKFFANSQGAATFGQVSLPQLQVPNSVPVGAVAVNSSYVYAIESAYPFGLNEGESAGQLYFQVNIVSGSPDVGSPQEFLVDPYTLFITSSDQYELP